MPSVFWQFRLCVSHGAHDCIHSQKVSQYAVRIHEVNDSDRQINSKFESFHVAYQHMPNTAVLNRRFIFPARAGRQRQRGDLPCLPHHHGLRTEPDDLQFPDQLDRGRIEVYVSGSIRFINGNDNSTSTS